MEVAASASLIFNINQLCVVRQCLETNKKLLIVYHTGH